MRLSDFIEGNIESVLDEWVAFARKQEGAEGMNLTGLRDHAGAMLRAIAVDLRTKQTDAEQFVKSQGEAPPSIVPSAAELHGGGRARDGFSVGEMVAEFRALRASVLQLWFASHHAVTTEDLNDLMRFNEAIDQALSESVGTYTGAVDRTHALLVAILGHDLRTPLHTITMVAEHLMHTAPVDATGNALVTRAVRSARRMQRMLDDVVDFTRHRMGVEIALRREPLDLATVVREAVDEVQGANPHAHFNVVLHGDLHGSWDGPRLTQLLVNLLGNAVQHGLDTMPIDVSALGGAEQVVVAVRNQGPTIAPADLSRLCSPFKRLQRVRDDDEQHHLGLGLFIVEQILLAHGGTLSVTSTDANGTCFTASLPRG
jgi:signal transduction histidine kinase